MIQSSMHTSVLVTPIVKIPVGGYRKADDPVLSRNIILSWLSVRLIKTLLTNLLVIT